MKRDNRGVRIPVKVGIEEEFVEKISEEDGSK